MILTYQGEKFMLYSDRIVKKFPTYLLDDSLTLISGPDSELINFNQLKELMLSKDMTRLGELQRLGDSD